MLAVALGFGQQTSAQGLTYSLFRSYLEALRQQSAIPGLSAAIVQDGRILWSAGLGKANVEANIDPTISTPYAIGGLSQVFASTLLQEKCVEAGVLDLNDRVVRWVPSFPDAASRLVHLLTHTTAAGTFQFDAGRYATLSSVIEQCTNVAYPKLLWEEIPHRFAMRDFSPSQALATPTADDRHVFDQAALDQFASAVGRMAVPYRVDASGRATRSDFAGEPLTASTGAIASVADLATFDGALMDYAMISPGSLQTALSQATANGAALPTGLGWFVQKYNDETLVWQFGVEKDAYSSLIVKLKNHNVTLILLANSDGLVAPFGLENGDVTASAFVKTFLRVFGI